MRQMHENKRVTDGKRSNNNNLDLEINGLLDYLSVFYNSQTSGGSENMNRILRLNDQTFDQDITNSEGIAVVDFYADWCGPCRQFMPVLEEVAEEFAGTVNFFKLNVDDSNDTASKFNIRTIPTLIIFVDGAAHETIVGRLPKMELISRIEDVLKDNKANLKV